ncbi:dienelactone hydrolase family protein [Pseudovibrio sp. SPO723]|uniref:dienelactone hydrolase family protein n=1 Tax=Nesiotobacter zosterae TaxID=392721 RepID=UPI0029C23D62|nr:dienelactone hydrolase family protein [Pseudovibrio sp. SPO723]MDX5593514.1 dienelactone hydrolase family protein [Pseudovibrio sp. SPO723]
MSKTSPNNRPVITQEMIKAYDEYTHLTLDRRGFLRRLNKFAGSSAAAAAIVPLLQANRAQAALVAPDDSRISSETVRFQGATSKVEGYLVRPAGNTDKLPAILVIHENRGLNEHLRDVARRLAIAGYMAMAVDFLSPVGGTPEDEDEARQKIRALDAQQTLQNAEEAVAYLGIRADSTGAVGAIGFCWGGYLVNNLAVVSPELKAAVSYYGRQPDTTLVPQISAALLLHYAGLDDRINAGIEDFRSALTDHGKDFTIYMYEGVNHAFNNDTSEARYDEKAAELAWKRTLAFFKEKLQS